MIDGMRPHPGLHPLGHETLIVADDHAVLLSDEIPGHTILPPRSIDGHVDAGSRDRSLHSPQYGQFLRRGIWSEGRGECGIRQIDQPVLVGSQLGRLRVRLGAIEDVGDGFSLVWSQGGDINERFHLLVRRRGDDGACIRMAGKNDRPGHSLQRPIEGRHIIPKRRQRQRCRDDLRTLTRERRDHFGPTRTVGPSAVNEYNGQIMRGHYCAPSVRRSAAPSVSPLESGFVAV